MELAAALVWPLNAVAEGPMENMHELSPAYLLAGLPNKVRKGFRTHRDLVATHVRRTSLFQSTLKKL